jgi:Type IV secretion-system coupling protein DNA-binding domain
MRFPELLILLSCTAFPLALLLIFSRAKLRPWLYFLPVAILTTLLGALTWPSIRNQLAQRLHEAPPALRQTTASSANADAHGKRIEVHTEDYASTSTAPTATPASSTTANSFPTTNSFVLYISGILYFIALGLCAGFLLAPRRSDTTHKRGTVITEGNAPRRKPKGAITLAGIPLNPFDETKHVKLIGTTGTGKSTAIREILSTALERGDRAIIADPDGGYAARFYDAGQGDAILNPFDLRSRRWDLFGEIHEPYDVEQLARALIPDNEGEERSWRNYARTFLTATTRQLWELDQREPGIATIPELYRLITMASTEELSILLDGTPAKSYLEGGNERMFGSIRSVASTYVAALDYLGRSTAEPLSVRNVIRPPNGHLPVRALYLPYTATQIAALRSTISAWLRLAIFETMSGPERDQRLWFFVDELDALGAIDGLKDALARLRKFGGRCVLGFQSIAQVSSTYGAGEAQTIVENCGSTLILRCSASEQGGTARFASRLIGEREIVRRMETRSRRPGEWRASRSYSSQHVTEPAVLPSEIEQLPDLCGFVKIAASPAWRRISLKPGS